MNLRIFAIALSFTLALAPFRSLAQTNLQGLNRQLQTAISSQNWQQAIQIVDQMLKVAPDQVAQLQPYRSRLQRLLKANVKSVPSFPTAPTANQTPGRPLGQVPIKRRQHGIAVIDVKFNHRLPFEMMVDSGASLTVITRPMAKALGVTTAQIVDEAIFETANGKTKMPIVYIGAIEVGGLSRTQVPVAVAGPEMDLGLLGQDFLQQYDVSFRGQTIEFHMRR